MSISLIDNFIINVKKPIDSRITANDSSDRDSIPLNYRYDGMRVFQRDDRLTYIWNDNTSSWEDEFSGDTILSGLGVTNSIAFWNSDSTIGNSILNIKINDTLNNKGYLGINTNDPKSEITISPSNSVGTNLDITNKDISFNLAYGVVGDSAKASMKMSFNDVTAKTEFFSRTAGSNPNDPLNKMFIIGTNTVESFGVYTHHQNTVLPGTTGSFHTINIKETPGGTGGNIVQMKNYVVRENNGTDWLTVKWHDGISIDGSYDTPNGPDVLSPSGGTLTFIERHPYLRKHYFGSVNYTVLTIDSNSSNRCVGINTKTPSTTLDIRGEFASGNGPFISLKNDLQGVSASTFGVGIMLDVNKSGVNKYFIGQRQDNNKFVISNGSSPFNDLMRIDQSGNLEITNFLGTTTSNLALVSDGGVIKTRNYTEILSSNAYLATNITNGLMSSLDKKRQPNNVGYFTLGDIHNVSIGSIFLVGGDCVSAIKVASPNVLEINDCYVDVTIPNAMSSANYYVRMFVESLGSINLDNDIANPVFKVISATKFKVGIFETSSSYQNIRIHFETIAY